MIHRLQRAGATLAVTLAASMFAATAFAQQQAPAQAAPAASAPRQAAAPAPTAAELQHFAHAASDVMSIRQATEPKLAAAKDAKAKTALEQAAQQKMEAAVRTHHLTVQRYEQIAMVVQTNSTVRNQVIKLMQKPAASS